jgi:hypothetical protein
MPIDAAATQTHGFAIFEDRVIFEAQPPITDDQVAEVERRVGRPLPPGLLALWRTAFGGSIGYALDVDFDDHVASFSFTELFYPGSGGYNDLWGWIDHEFEIARESGDVEATQGRLRYLPFGGFEYLDRLYVCLEDGPDYGAVVAWMRGLPPAWALRLHEDSVARIADDAPALFRMLALEADPFAEDRDDYGAGIEMADAIAALRDKDPVLADALTATARKALLDWRTALDAGTLVGDTRLRHLALHHAAAEGDLALIDRLAAQGCDLQERYNGRGNLLDHLLARGHDTAADALIARDVDPSNAIAAGASRNSAERTAQLIALGATVDPVAARTAAYTGHLDSARLIADALLAAGARDALSEMIRDVDHSARSAEDSARRIDNGTLGSNRSADQYRAQAADLRALKAHGEALLAR